MDDYVCAVCLLTREMVSDQYPAKTIWRGTAFCETHLQEAVDAVQWTVEAAVIDGSTDA